jgi:hypothetical protein
MPRGFFINGPCLVEIGFPAQYGGSGLEELGLSTDSVQVIPHFEHYEKHIDNFGPNVPADLIGLGGWAEVRMTLVHFNPVVLRACINESLAGGFGAFGGQFTGLLGPIGEMFGNGVKAYRGTGSHFVGVCLTSPYIGFPWRFLSAVLQDQATWPLGTKTSMVDLSWKCLPRITSPYQNSTTDLRSTGAAIWDHIRG